MENTTEKPARPKRRKRAFYVILLAVVFGLIFFISRGEYISNALKEIILPELESAFGQKVTVQKIYLNIFPLFVEAKGLKVIDSEGNEIISTERVKGYVGLSGILNKRISLFRLVIKEPHISADRKSTRLNSSHRLTSRMPSSA
jgi:hypothetical protein